VLLLVILFTLGQLIMLIQTAQKNVINTIGVEPILNILVITFVGFGSKKMFHVLKTRVQLMVQENYIKCPQV